MKVVFRSDDLRRVSEDAEFSGSLNQDIVSRFRLRIQTIESAEDERAFYKLRSLRFEKLKGERSGQYSMRLNDQWRLILEFDGKGQDKVVTIVDVVDYH